MGFPGASAGKESSCNVGETHVQSPGWEDPLEKETATYSSILAWRIPWTVWSIGSQRVGHNWATFTSLCTHIHTYLYTHTHTHISVKGNDGCKDWLMDTETSISTGILGIASHHTSRRPEFHWLSCVLMLCLAPVMRADVRNSYKSPAVRLPWGCWTPRLWYHSVLPR